MERGRLVAMRVCKNIVGPTIQRLRNTAEMSQPALAALCQRLGWDMSREILAQIESRRRYVTDWELMVLARALKVEVGTFFPSQFKKRTGSIPGMGQIL